jgi:D-alanyl-D-alanine carboxypeptidase
MDGPFDADSGIVDGNLYIRGGGDPGFTAERLWLLEQHLFHFGVKRVKGNLVLDDFFFDSVLVGPGFDEDSTSRAYSPHMRFVTSFNTLAVHVGREMRWIPVAVDIFPKIAASR